MEASPLNWGNTTLAGIIYSIGWLDVAASRVLASHVYKSLNKGQILSSMAKN